MDSGRMAQFTATIRRETGLKEPLNHYFKGDHGGSNLSARLVRGELPQSRVWEDGEHVAFLTPFANTPGSTVLVHREHRTSDIFSFEDTAYAKTVDASYTLAGCLWKRLGYRAVASFSKASRWTMPKSNSSLSTTANFMVGHSLVRRPRWHHTMRRTEDMSHLSKALFSRIKNP